MESITPAMDRLEQYTAKASEDISLQTLHSFGGVRF